MRIFIIGRSRSGKSLAARYLAEALACDWSETSTPVIRELAELCKVSSGMLDDGQCWERLIRVGKDEFRAELQRMGDLMVRLRPGYLIRECCARSRIIVGVRRRCEVLDYFRHHDPSGWRSVWIKIIAENSRPDPHFELDHAKVDFEVINNGDPSSLAQQMNRISRLISGTPAQAKLAPH